jgi:hypothetical protein
MAPIYRRASRAENDRPFGASRRELGVVTKDGIGRNTTASTGPIGFQAATSAFRYSFSGHRASRPPVIGYDRRPQLVRRRPDRGYAEHGRHLSVHLPDGARPRLGMALELEYHHLALPLAGVRALLHYRREFAQKNR